MRKGDYNYIKANIHLNVRMSPATIKKAKIKIT